MSDEKKLLLHACCAPCTIYPLGRLEKSGWRVTVYFYNPNIHPFTEFETRFEAVEEYCDGRNTSFAADLDYDVYEFVRKAGIDDGARCLACYRMRLEQTIRRAAQEGYDAVSTTLLFSIYQDHEAIRTLGEELSRDAGIEFYYEDFRAGWDEGRRLSRDLGMYQQKYCGCIFSEQNRYEKKIKRLRHSVRTT
ncbi:MAG: epoxyqueuosine reductase QueH [Deltaproteobacteria bacterium]|nr:epoxyqueuosine reductase QueH [Candidatus Zymogenaceae bacterium]